jgi:hypothetical protein
MPWGSWRPIAFGFGAGSYVGITLARGFAFGEQVLSMMTEEGSSRHHHLLGGLKGVMATGTKFAHSIRRYLE